MKKKRRHNRIAVIGAGPMGLTCAYRLVKKGFEVEVVQVQINRSKEMPWGQRMEAMNPVWIISGIKYE